MRWGNPKTRRRHQTAIARPQVRRTATADHAVMAKGCGNAGPVTAQATAAPERGMGMVTAAHAHAMARTGGADHVTLS